jgi:DNA polymerase III delta subunit
MTWLRKKLGDDVCQSLLASDPGEILRKAAEVALFESARVAWVVTASDPPNALAQAAADLLSASQTGRPAGLFIVESSESGSLLRALVEFARHWPNVPVEVAPLTELPARVVAWCSAGEAV